MSILEQKIGQGAERTVPTTVAREPCSEAKDALAGVKIVEFGAYAAGPCISKYLANFGARVVHVESRQRPDGFRLQYPPFKDGQVGLTRSGCFAFFNDSNHGVTLGLKNAAWLRLAQRWGEWSHIGPANLRAGVMARLRLE